MTKTIIIFATLCIVACHAVHPVQDGSLTETEEFLSYMEVYNKQYATMEEKNKRMSIFLKNKEFVINHNNEYAKGIHTFSLELNAFADITNEEYKAKYLGLKMKFRKKFSIKF